MNIINVKKRSLLRILFNNNFKCLSIIRFYSNEKIDKRKVILDKLKLMHINKEELDVIIIGGGSVGCGSALDASLRGLDVACFEREDFSSGTSSRSTKLIWGGSRYLVMAFVELFNQDLRLFRRPVETIHKFKEAFKMVLNCHRERKFLLEMQPHLTNWIPIAVPLIRWIQWPPPFGWPPAIFGAFGLYSLFFKFYDSLSGFTCPPSHVMTRSRAMRKFPQLANQQIKYCPIFYEGQHDDARTNLSIALTASEVGAKMLNYCEIISLLRNDNNKAIGVIVKNLLNNEIFEVRSKSILFCGGPFTDELRKLEEINVKKAVNGAGGIHIVLPSYFAPTGIGLVDMSTSDGRFLFLLPWEGHVLVGTTDHFSEASMRPEPDESEIRWLLTEASKYLSPELRLRRQDVLSAWKGIRPLASDPNVDQSAVSSSISRDHVISYNKESGIVFIAGGKWTTYREMAEDAIDYIIKTSDTLKNKTIQPCSTLTKHLIGYDGYTSNLHIRLIQEFGIASSVAIRLARAYGGNAYEVLKIAKDELGSIGRGTRIFPGYPYIEAEVIYAIRKEFAVTADDILARRTRLAFLNKEAAISAIPKVVELMAKELKWDKLRQKNEIKKCLEYLRHFGGPHSHRPSELTFRQATLADIREVFIMLCPEQGLNGKLDCESLQSASEMLGHFLTPEENKTCMLIADKDKDGFINIDEFTLWWNSSSCNPSYELFKGRIDPNVDGSGTFFG